MEEIFSFKILCGTNPALSTEAILNQYLIYCFPEFSEL